MIPSGYWRGFDSGWNDADQGRLWPYTDAVAGGMADWRPNLDGGYSILPIVLHDSAVLNVYGELDGVGAVTGFGQAAENTLTNGLAQWLVIQNVFRTSKIDYFAVRLA